VTGSRVSFDQWLLHFANHGDAQTAESIDLIRTNDGGKWQHRVLGIDVCCIFCSLLDGFHFGLATCVVEWADDDRLFENDILRTIQRGLITLAGLIVSSQDTHFDCQVILHFVQACRCREASDCICRKGCS
jgi:hypothetical protein